MTAPVVASVRRPPPAPATAGGPLPAETKPGRVARVAVLGASGYSGHEFVRLTRGHEIRSLKISLLQ